MISIVTPAHNESDAVEPMLIDLINELRKRGRPFEIVVVENGSSDSTLALVSDLANEHPEIQVLTSEVADYGRALRTGILQAKGEMLVTFDVDFYSLSFLDDAVALMERPSGPVIVVGSKRAPGANDTRGPGRRIVTAVFSTILRIGFGLRVSDTHGIKAYRASVIAPLAERCTSGTDLFDTELILRAERLGLPIAEVPVTVEESRPPRSSIIRRIPRSLIGLVRLRVHLRHLSPSRENPADL